MELLNLRYNGTKTHTDGLLFIDEAFENYTLEDEKRAVKVKGKTRIPNGRYRICFRTVGGFHGKYLAKFGADFHKGMLHVMDVPGFEYILIHIGNTDGDTAGCLLVGSSSDYEKAFIGGSGTAYKKMYVKVRDALLRGEDVFITYKEIGTHLDGGATAAYVSQ